MAELGNRELGGRVIEAAIAVHTALGPGFPEPVYENALAVELTVRGIWFNQQKVVEILYRGVEVGEHRLELLVEGVMLVELKAVRELEDIFFMIARAQMKAATMLNGTIFNFATIPLAVKRVAPCRIDS